MHSSGNFSREKFPAKVATFVTFRIVLDVTEEVKPLVARPWNQSNQPVQVRFSKREGSGGAASVEGDGGVRRPFRPRALHSMQY